MRRKESEKERGLEIGGRDREGIERWSAKRVFTLQRNQSARRLMVPIVTIIRTNGEQTRTIVNV